MKGERKGGGGKGKGKVGEGKEVEGWPPNWESGSASEGKGVERGGKRRW